mgnify:CR=1 FL=1
MGKNKNKKYEPINYNNEKIINNNIGNLCTDLMKIFAANTNLMRHVPSLVDGLKPGERRIIFTMFKNKILHNNKFMKVATITGDTMKVHPHGDGPIYETLVKMAQPWNNILCPIEGKGNFGTLAGSPAAAARYIEARLSYYSWKCFLEEYDENIIDMKPNYSNDFMEPEFLPSKYPNVLVNNSFGIGYGISCGIPNYNFTEVIELTKKLIDDPHYDDVTLIPDSPTGAFVVDEGNFKEISETGKGKFKMRGEIDIDFENNILLIKSVPFQTSAYDIKTKIIQLFKDNKLQGLKRVNDKSGKRTGLCMEFHLKKEIDPVAIKHLIYTKTDMEKTFPISFKLIDDYKDNDYNIRSILLDWIEFRRETKRNIYNQKLTYAKERQHTLQILLFILNKDNAEKTLDIIRNSENKKEIIKKLMAEYGITSLQAQTISDMRFSAFTKDAVKGYKEEMKEIDEKIKKYDKIIRSTKKIDKIIKEELDEGIKLFGYERKSKVINIDGEQKIRDTNHIIVFTLNGFVKKLPDQCKSIGFINKNDYPIEIVEARNTSELLLFDESGKISKLPIHVLQNHELSGEGEKLSKFCNITGKITSIIPKPSEEILNNLKTPIYFLMITKDGIMKKTLANDYSNIKNELLGMIVKDSDKLKTVKLLAGDKDIVIYTSKGFGVRLSSEEIKVTSRLTKGITAIDMVDGEEVIGMDLINEKDKYLFMLTNKGNGKKSDLNAFPVKERKTKPLRLLTLNDDEEVLLIKPIKGNEKFNVYMKNGIEQINIEDVILLPRLSKGKKLIGVRKGDNIIDIKEIK